LPNIWSAEAWRIVGALAAGTLIGLVIGIPYGLLLALLGYLLSHLYQIGRLARWLAGGARVAPPEAGGVWGELFNDLHRVQQRARLRKQRMADILSRFQQASSAMPDAIVVLGAAGEIQWLNESAERLLGLSGAQDHGSRIDNLVRHPDFVAYLGKADYRNPLVMPSPEDSRVTLRLRVVSYGDHQRLLIARDTSQVQRVEQVRRDFVANVSHELRTPLTVMVGFLETMEDADDECARQWEREIALMRQQAERMTHVVEDLLFLSRLETGQEAPADEAVPVAEMLESIRDAAVALSGERGHQIALEADAGLKLLGVERELFSAFSNLVSNAVRYTPDGGSINIRWYGDSLGGHFAVSDTGVGIEPRHIPRLTERFYRVDVGRSRQSGGTGLGLAIVKHVLTRHEARLEVDSQLGKGSTFLCHFPPRRVRRA